MIITYPRGLGLLYLQNIHFLLLFQPLLPHVGDLFRN